MASWKFGCFGMLALGSLGCQSTLENGNPEEKPDAGSCEAVRSEMRGMLDAANTCEGDSDCIAVDAACLDGPVQACEGTKPANRGLDLSRFNQLRSELVSCSTEGKCPTCEESDASSRCDQGHCVLVAEGTIPAACESIRQEMIVELDNHSDCREDSDCVVVMGGCLAARGGDCGGAYPANRQLDAAHFDQLRADLVACMPQDQCIGCDLWTEDARCDAGTCVLWNHE